MEKIQRSINEEFLERFLNTPSPTGAEEPAQKLYREYLVDIADQITTDILGNVDAVLNVGDGPKIMLAGHVDEVGLQIRYITEKGFIYFNQLGGVDAHITPGNRVKILSGKGEILGVIGKKAIHLQQPDERTKVIKLKDQYIDIGARTRQEVEELGIKIGDPVVFISAYTKLGNNGDVVARCFDDKIGGFIIAEVLRELKGSEFDAEVHGVSTTQEEIGTRGAIVSSFGINPQVGIAFDVTHASDSPDVKESDIGIKPLGGGPTFARGPNINPKLLEMMVETAKELEIPYTIIAAAGPTGTDARSMQMAQAGVATALIGIPNRYMHTMNEVVNLDDVDAIIKIVVALIKKIKKDTSFIPM
ncbi:MAG: M42 family metallopeptidase [Promethearchaeota archaeon]